MAILPPKKFLIVIPNGQEQQDSLAPKILSAPTLSVAKQESATVGTQFPHIEETNKKSSFFVRTK